MSPGWARPAAPQTVVAPAAGRSGAALPGAPPGSSRVPPKCGAGVEAGECGSCVLAGSGSLPPSRSFWTSAHWAAAVAASRGGGGRGLSARSSGTAHCQASARGPRRAPTNPPCSDQLLTAGESWAEGPAGLAPSWQQPEGRAVALLRTYWPLTLCPCQGQREAGPRLRSLAAWGLALGGAGTM